MLRRLLLLVLFLSAFNCVAEKDSMSEAIKKSDFELVEKLLKRTQLSQNEFIRYAELAEQIIVKRKSNIELYELKGTFVKDVLDRVEGDEYVKWMGGMFVLGLACTVSLCRADLLCNSTTLGENLGKKMKYACISGTAVLFAYASIRFLMAQIRIEQLIYRLYDDAIAIKDVILREYARSLAN